MSEPVAGQWYEWQEQRVYCVGQDSHGHTIVNNKCGTLNILRGKLIDELKHLPDCTGWDWEPETFPQWWTTLDGSSSDVAFVKRLSAKSWFAVHKDGSDGPDMNDISPWNAKYRTRLTEAEALALLDPQPAEDPEEWVVQDRVPARGIDQERWVDGHGTPTGPWKYSVDRCLRHGETGGTDYRLELRCRRKDLPKPKPRRTVTVPKWLVIDDVGSMSICEQSGEPSGMTFIEVHRVGETTYEIE